MRSYKLGALAVLLTGIVVLRPPTRPVQQGWTKRDDSRMAATNNKIQLNFRDVEILNVINLMSELTGKNF